MTTATVHPPMEQEVAVPTVYRRGGRGPWYCAYTRYDGRRVCVSTKSHDRRTAVLVASQMEARHGLVRLGLATPDSLMVAERGLIHPATLLDRWAASLNGSNMHRKTWRSWAAAFIEAGRVVACSTFASPEIVERLAAWLESQSHLAQETVAKKRMAVASFGRWLVANGYTAVNKADSMPAPRGDTARRVLHRALTADEAHRLWAGPRGDYYAFRCLTGLRGTEAVGLVRADLDLGDRPSLTVRPEVAKNGLGCRVPLCVTVAATLEPYTMLAPASPLFPDVSRSRSGRRDQWRADAKAAGLGDGINERSLRMTFVSWLTASGADLAAVIRLRRDKGKGSERLAVWTYGDDATVDAGLRAALAGMERWMRNALRRKEMA